MEKMKRGNRNIASTSHSSTSSPSNHEFKRKIGRPRKKENNENSETSPNQTNNENEAGPSTTVNQHLLLSSRHNNTIIAIVENDGIGMRKYALAGTTRDGHVSHYRCNRCERLIRQGVEGRMARVKTVDGQVVGNAHPKHVDGCKMFNRNDVFVNAILRECRRDIRTNNKTPRVAYAEALDRILLARDELNKAENSGGGENPLPSLTIPNWKVVNKSFYWQARQAVSNNLPPSPDRVLDPPPQHTSNRELIEEILQPKDKAPKTNSSSSKDVSTPGPSTPDPRTSIKRESSIDFLASHENDASIDVERLFENDTVSDLIGSSNSANFICADSTLPQQQHQTYLSIEANDLLKLFRRCQQCGSLLNDVRLLSENIEMPTIRWQCSGGCGISTWTFPQNDYSN